MDEQEQPNIAQEEQQTSPTPPSSYTKLIIGIGITIIVAVISVVGYIIYLKPALFCNYSASPDKIYVGNNEVCARAFYTCEQGWDYFNNVCGCGCEKIDAADTSDWKTYTNEEFGFEVKYPRDFNITLVDSSHPNFIEGHLISGENDVPNFLIYIYDNPNILPVEIWYEEVLSDKEYTVPDSKVRNTKTVSINGIGSLQLNSNIFLNIYERTYVPAGDIIVGLESWAPDIIEYPELYFDILSTFKFIEPQASVDTSDWQTYTNEEFGFEFIYPANLFREDFDDFDLVVLRLSPPDGLESPSLSISVHYNPNNLSSENYYDGHHGPSLYTQTQSKDIVDIVVGSKDAIKFDPTVTFAGGEIIVIPIESAFVVVSDSGGTFRHKKLLDPILSTFKFIEPQSEVNLLQENGGTSKGNIKYVECESNLDCTVNQMCLETDVLCPPCAVGEDGQPIGDCTCVKEFICRGEP